MRRLVLAALLAVTAAPALAQVPPPEVRDERGHRGDRDAQAERGARPDNRDARSDTRDVRQNGAVRQNGEVRQDNRDLRQDNRDLRQQNRDVRQDDRRMDQNARGDERRDYRQDERRDYRHDDQGGRDYRGDERRDYGNRGDVRQDYRQAFRDDRRGYGDEGRARFHADRYFYPRGYSYRYYSVGTFLPRVFFDQRYYIGNPYAYRLPQAYAGTRWIRVGPDALLIRVYDGRVVRVIQGLFY